jgi:hypothetical protein
VPQRETPPPICDLADLSEVEVSDLELPGPLSFENVLLLGSTFELCGIGRFLLRGSDLGGIVFRDCKIDAIEIDDCDGPIDFDTCRIKTVVIKNVRALRAPAVRFLECEIDQQVVVHQEHPSFGAASWDLPVQFIECLLHGTITISGELLAGRHEEIAAGLARPSDTPAVDRAGEATKAMLRPFFPRHVGEAGSLQPRPYIRLTALGRGRQPVGAPDNGMMKSILEAYGFSTGGRHDHLYAPWSPVVGGGANEIEFRNELQRFLRTGQRSDRVSNLIARVARQMR